MDSKNIDRPRVHKNIDGTNSKETKRVGFCSNLLHRGYLTKNLMEEHECIEKKCPYFIKYEKNSYWIQKEISKEKRKKAKEEKKYWAKKEDDVLYYLRDLTKNIEDFCITSTLKRESIIEVRYVSLIPIDLYAYQFMVEQALGVKCKLLPIITNNSKKIELLKIFNVDNPEYLRENTDIKVLTKSEIEQIKEDIKLKEKSVNKTSQKEQKKQNAEIKQKKTKIKTIQKVTKNSTNKKVRGFKGYPKNYYTSSQTNSVSELLGCQATDFDTIDFVDDSVFKNEEE